MREALREALVSRGGVEPAMLTHAEAVHAHQGGSFAVALMRTGADPLRLLDAFCLVSGLPPAPRTHVRRPTPQRLNGLDEPMCRRFFAVPFDTAADGRLRIAFADPEAAEDAKTLGWPDHVAYLAQPTAVCEGLDALFSAHKASTAPPADLPTVDDAGWTVYEKPPSTIDGASPSTLVDGAMTGGGAAGAPKARYQPPPWAVGVGGGPAASPSWADAVQSAALEPASIGDSDASLPVTASPASPPATTAPPSASSTQLPSPPAFAQPDADAAPVEREGPATTMFDEMSLASANDNVDLTAAAAGGPAAPADADHTPVGQNGDPAPASEPTEAEEGHPVAVDDAARDVEPAPSQTAGGRAPVPSVTFDDATPPTVRLSASGDDLDALVDDAVASVDTLDAPDRPAPGESDPAINAFAIDVASDLDGAAVDEADPTVDDSEDISIDLASNEGAAAGGPGVSERPVPTTSKPLVTDVLSVAVRAPDDDKPAFAPAGRVLGPELDPALPAPHEAPSSTRRRRPQGSSGKKRGESSGRVPTRLDRAPARQRASGGALEIVLLLVALVVTVVVIARADTDETPRPTARPTSSVADARVRMHLLRAQKKLDQEQPLAAIPVADAVLKASPSPTARAEALLIRANAWAALEDGPRAHADLRAAMAAAPGSEVAQRAEGTLHMLVLPDGPAPKDRSAAAAIPAQQEAEEAPWP